MTPTLGTELLGRLNTLRRPDNLTNWFYIARAWLWLALILRLTLGWYELRAAQSFSWLWDIPVTALAVALVGIGQHHLAVLGHEGSHYILFRHRVLNDLASDVLCFYPLFSTTDNYRGQHFPHHQFTNDPERDPDWQFLKQCGHGHRFHHRMSAGRSLWRCVIQPLLWVPGLIAYIFIRASATVLGFTSSGGSKGGKVVTVLSLGYLALALGAPVLALCSGPGWLWLVPPALLLVLVAASAVLPASWYPVPALKPILPPRWSRALRLSFFTLLFLGLSGLTYLTGRPVFFYYFVLWMVPLGTTFAFLMILREDVQHSNAGREGYEHTRNYAGSWLVRQTVFPLGMNWHLPHHLFPSIPHYALEKAHELLSESEEYRRGAVVLPEPAAPR